MSYKKISAFTSSKKIKTLWCLVNKKPPNFAFLIDVDVNDSEITVGHLREIIEGKINFSNKIRANDLTLWKVNIPFGEENVTEIAVTLENNKEMGIQRLTFLKKISTAFFKEISKETIHIIVKLLCNINPLENEVEKLKILLFNSENGNSTKSSSVYKYIRNNYIVSLWDIEKEIKPNRHVEETIQFLKMNNLIVLGENCHKKDDKIYSDLLIGYRKFYQKLSNNSPDLIKGLGWEVKNDLTDSSKLMKEKG
ncbi:19393_t:CDS:2 [Dentiscutata erythropus]|uniref:19393_t:CDS:1 n=1 Tax=Dentiscutata erythropus TaxID=1348616 RepID=A0A9N9GSA9_9GLOM|nr:19393_t:CDS:2 [Dentiscutata erythropus]